MATGRPLGRASTVIHAPDVPGTLRDAFVVVPAYNEAGAIRDVVQGLAAVFQNIVVVDDGSWDGTRAVLADLPVTVLTHLVNLGQGAALQTGIAHAVASDADCVVTFDADGQHRVEDAAAAVRMLREEGCDAVFGSRFLGPASNVPPVRKAILKTVVALGNLASGMRMTDAHNGLRALSRRAASCLDLTQPGMAHASEILAQLRRHGMDIRELPVQIRYTEYSMRKGQSSLNSLNILLDLVIGRFLK